MLRVCTYTMLFFGRGEQQQSEQSVLAPEMSSSELAVGKGWLQSVLGDGVGGPQNCLLPLSTASACSAASGSPGVVFGGHATCARLVLPRGLCRQDHLLPVVIIPSHGVQQLPQRLAADWAAMCPTGLPPDAGEAEVLCAGGHVGCGLACLRHMWHLESAAASAVHGWGGWLLLPSLTTELPSHVFLGTQRYVLPRETRKMLELVWQGGTGACSARFMGSKSGGGMA